MQRKLSKNLILCVLFSVLMIFENINLNIFDGIALILSGLMCYAYFLFFSELLALTIITVFILFVMRGNLDFIAFAYFLFH